MNGSIYEYSLSSIPFVPGLNLLVKTPVSWPTVSGHLESTAVGPDSKS